MNKNSSDEILDTLRSLIGSTEFAQGTRLPPERELTERLQTNRASIRKALAQLEYEGKITRHVGRGTFVTERHAQPSDLSASASPVELMDARLILEPVIAREAAMRARLTDLAHMEDLLRHSEEADKYEEFEQWDIMFHQALADATQNAVLTGVNVMLRNLRSTPEWDRFKRASFSADSRALYRQEHRAILKALSTRDPAAASSAMVTHVRSIYRALTTHG